MSNEVPYEGVTVRLGGREFVVPPLSFGYMRKNREKLQGLDPSQTIDDLLDIQIQVAHAALSRNYPDLTTEEVGELLDNNTSKVLFESIKKASGYAASGEAKPATAAL